MDLQNGYVRKLEERILGETKNERQWYVPRHPVINPHKPEKVWRVCNAAAKYKGESLNHKLLTGPDMLQNLLGINCRLQEHQIALTAGIEAMFLQVEVPPEECRLLRVLWRSLVEKQTSRQPWSLWVYETRLRCQKQPDVCQIRSFAGRRRQSSWSLKSCEGCQNKHLYGRLGKIRGHSRRSSPCLPKCGNNPSKRRVHFAEVDLQQRSGHEKYLWEGQIRGEKQNLRSRASYFNTSGHAMECGQRDSGSLSWSWQRSSQQYQTTSSVVVCSIRLWPSGTLCTVRNENAHPTEDNLGQKWTTVGWKNWSGRRTKIFWNGSKN